MHLRSPAFCLGNPSLTATGTLSIEVLEVNDHAPLLLPVTSELCSQGGRLVLSATDDDLAPHAEPFHFRLSPDMAQNWTLGHINGNLDLVGVSTPTFSRGWERDSTRDGISVWHSQSIPRGLSTPP